VAGNAARLAVGDLVYARDQYLGVLAGGFAVAQVLPEGYLLTRLSDGWVLPDVFPFDFVRAERRSDPFRSRGSPAERRSAS